MHAVIFHRHARPAVGPRLGLETVKIKTIHTGAKRPVAQRLQSGGISFPIFTGLRGECFAGDNRPARRMRNGCGLDDRESSIETVIPELALRYIGHAAHRKIAGGIQIVRFNGKREPILVRQLREIADVIFDHKFLRRAPEVPQKTLGDFLAAHNASGVGGQKFQEIVTTTFVKFFAEIGRPVLRTHFPTVEMQRRQAPGGVGVRTVLGEHLFDESSEMRVQRGAVELVSFKAKTRLRRWSCGLAGQGAAQPHYRPLARRHFPIQMSVRRQF